MDRLYPKPRRARCRATTRLSLYGFVLWSAVGLLMAPSCTTAESDVADFDSKLRITLAPSIMTRVSGTAFDQGDAIGLTVVPWENGAEQPLSGVRWEDNVKFEYRDGRFIATATAYFPDATTPNTFYAYYPYDAVGFDAGSSTLAVGVAVDQRDAQARMTSDRLVAVAREVIPDGEAVPVSFRHVLSQMLIQVKAGEGVTADELLDVDVQLKSFSTTARYDVDAGQIDQLSDVSDIQPFGHLSKASDGMLSGLSAIVVPQTRLAGESVLYFTFRGKTLAYKPGSDFTFESGRSHLFTATIGMTSQGPTLCVSTQIAEWQEGDVIVGDANRPEPSGETVLDADGNEYSVVEIAGKRWLTSNLRTTHYNDGTEIPVVEGGTDEWVALTKPAACAPENNADYRDRYGLLYNFYAVEPGNLCPKGWKVPSREELETLPFSTMKGSYSLMAPDENWSSMYEPTNTTGFSALPAGMLFDNSWLFGDAYFWSSTFDDTQSFPASYLYLSMYSYMDTHYKRVAMSVRCVEDESAVEPEPDPAPTSVTDVDGNEYPVVEIGGLTWMAANLRTLHLTDGTEIPIALGNDMSWDGKTSPAACDFMDDPDNRPTYGLLYNYYTVDTGKLCPEGWSLPDWDQTQSLLDAVPSAADLMAPDSRWDYYNPTNASGFGALPGGIASCYYWYMTEAGFWTSYKSGDTPYYLYLSNLPYIDSYYMTSGMYVRCVKVN